VYRQAICEFAVCRQHFCEYQSADDKEAVLKILRVYAARQEQFIIPLYRGDPAMVIELKRNDCTESALNQIRQKQYFDSLQHYKGSMLLIGINYDEKEKTHTCAIERVEKTV